MTDEELFNQIHSLANPSLISNKLKEYPREFVDNYRKYFHKLRVAKSRELNKDKINQARREARRLLNKTIEKPIQHIDKPIDIDAVDTSIKRNYKASTKIAKLNENTADNYIKTIKALYPKYHNDKPLADDAEILKLLNGVKYNSTKLYKQNKYIIDNIKDIATNHSSYLTKLYSIFSRLNGKNLKQLREAIYPYMTAYNANYTENRSNVVVNKEMTSKISFDTKDVIENANKINDVYDKLMYMLLFLMPTRRLYDYRITRIATKKGDIEDMKYNWYYQGKFYINNTKNKKMMILDVPREIIDVINQLPPDTDYIFGKLYNAPTLSRKFAKITNDIYGNSFNAVDVRRLFATYNLKTAGNTGDTKTMRDNARKMGHSLDEHLNYAVK